MKIEGQTPLKGTPAEKPSVKAPPKTAGKPFGTAFDKAVASPNTSLTAPAPNPIVQTPSPELTATPALTHPEGPLKDSQNSEISHEDNLETIKFRLKTGYYNSKPVTDALTEKLSGFFDELA